MSSSAAGAISRGPLSSVLSQWSVLGLGALGLYGNEDFCSSILRGIQKLLIGGSLLGNNSNNPNLWMNNPQQQHLNSAMMGPGIGRYSVGNNSSNYYYMWYLMQLGMGTLICWGSYVAFANLLPDAVKSVLPVSKKVFDTAVESLGKAVIHVRDALKEQILGIERKQDELSLKLDDTHDEVLHVKAGVDELGDMVYRCEQSLSQGERRQLYTAKGIRLLLRCISTMLPASSKFNSELDQYHRQGNDLGLGSSENISGNYNDADTTLTAASTTSAFSRQSSMMTEVTSQLDSSFDTSNSNANDCTHVKSTPVRVNAIPIAQVSPCHPMGMGTSILSATRAANTTSSTCTPQKSSSMTMPKLDDLQNMMQMMKNIGIQG